MKTYWIGFAAIITAALISLAYAQATNVQSPLPAGWLRTGNAAQSYTITVQPKGGVDGNASAVLRSRFDAVADKCATLMQQFQADGFRGQSVRFSAKVRANNDHRIKGALDASGRSSGQDHGVRQHGGASREGKHRLDASRDRAAGGA